MTDSDSRPVDRRSVLRTTGVAAATGFTGLSAASAATAETEVPETRGSSPRDLSTTASNLDQAEIEFEAKSGYHITGIEFESNMSNLPKSADGNDVMLVPSHSTIEWGEPEQVAVFNRPGGNDNYPGPFEVSTAYLDDGDCDGTNNHFGCPDGEWRDREVRLISGPDTQPKMEAYAEDYYGNFELLGSNDCSGYSGEQDFNRVDFMTELWWDGTLDLPAVDPSENQTIINWVHTADHGEMRPLDCLQVLNRVYGDEAILETGEDSWGRIWLSHGIDN